MFRNAISSGPVSALEGIAKNVVHSTQHDSLDYFNSTKTVPVEGDFWNEFTACRSQVGSVRLMWQYCQVVFRQKLKDRLSGVAGSK